MSHRRSSSCLHGPRPISSRRSSSSSFSSFDSVQEFAEEPSPHSTSQFGNVSRSISSTSSSLFVPAAYEDSIHLSTSDANLKRRSHVRRSHRQKPLQPRPLPPIPRQTRPSLSLYIPSSADSNRQSRPRWLPVPPLPMSPFPTSTINCFCLSLLDTHQLAV